MPGSPQRTNRYYANVLLRGKVGSIMCSLSQRIHFLSYLVFHKPKIPISSLDFDSHPPSHNQISPRVDEDGVSGYNWCVVSNITELLHPIFPPILTCGHLISCSCCCYIFLFLHDSSITTVSLLFKKDAKVQFNNKLYNMFFKYFTAKP